MADNVTINGTTQLGGAIIATDDIGSGVQCQRVKLALGRDGVDDGNVSSSQPLPVSFPLWMYDAFGHLSVSQPETLFSSALKEDNQPLLWDDQQTAGTASSTFSSATASVTLSVDANVTGTRVRQTFRAIPYQPGKGQNIKLTGILGTPTANVTRRIGSFNAAEGYFWESNGTDVRCVVRSSISGSPSDSNFARQSEWNIDRLDGSGGTLNPSGITADFSRVQIFGVKYQWLGVGSVFFYLVIDGHVIVVHRFDCANHNTSVYLGQPNLPLRYELSASSTHVAASLVCICASVESDGGAQTTGLSRPIPRGNTALVTANNNTSIYPLLCIRLRSGYAGRQVKIKDMEVALGTAGALGRAWIAVDPSFTGTALSWSALATANSGIEIATPTNATTISGGTPVGSSMFCASAGAARSAGLSEGQLDYFLGTNIAGTAQIVALAFQNVTAQANDVYGQLTVVEG